MKDKVVADMAPYSQWSGFERQIGPYVSQLVLEVESEAF
jgi:hypothetical protein